MLLVKLCSGSQRELEADWKQADLLCSEPADIDPHNPRIKGLRAEVADRNGETL
jgi:hypothetical protein